MRRILCFGDSNTYGYSPIDGERYGEDIRWPGVLNQKLGERFEVINEGKNGRTIGFDDPYNEGCNGMNDIVSCIEENAPIDLVVIMLGTNDLKVYFESNPQDIADNLQKMCELVKDNTDAKVIIASPMLLGDQIEFSPLHLEFGRTQVDYSFELAPQFEKVANEVGADFIDLAVVAMSSDMDCLHLMPEEHAKIAQAMEDKVLDVFSEELKKEEEEAAEQARLEEEARRKEEEERQKAEEEKRLRLEEEARQKAEEEERLRQEEEARLKAEEEERLKAEEEARLKAEEEARQKAEEEARLKAEEEERLKAEEEARKKAEEEELREIEEAAKRKQEEIFKVAEQEVAKEEGLSFDKGESILFGEDEDVSFESEKSSLDNLEFADSKLEAASADEFEEEDQDSVLTSGTDSILDEPFMLDEPTSQFSASDDSEEKDTSVQKANMLSGKLYFCDSNLIQAHREAKKLTDSYNLTDAEDQDKRDTILVDLLNHVGDGTYIETPFRCDYGFNISVGEDFYANFDCIMLDAGKINIGDHVFFGPRVSVYTATHPVYAPVRNEHLEYSKDITIGDDVWVGGDVTINPGVHIGSNVVIGSGSVVTRDIPDGVIAAGNPCRIIRKISEDDRKYWEEKRKEYQD